MLEGELAHAPEQEASQNVYRQCSRREIRAGAVLDDSLQGIAQQGSGGAENGQQYNSQATSIFPHAVEPNKKLLSALRRPGVISPAERGGFRRTPSP